MERTDMRIDKQALRRQADRLCRDRGAELVFLTVFGSDLYGAGRPGGSDLDVRGLFLPTMESLVLGTAPKSIHEATGRSDRRNQAQDVDLDLWSVGHWLKLLAAGDIGAMDLIFAPSNHEALIYLSPKLHPFFSRPLKVLDIGGSRAYAEYSLSQARKYGLKGSRLGSIKAVRNWLDRRSDWGPDERLEPYLKELVDLVGDENLCRPATVQERPGLCLGGKLFGGRLKMAEFARRVTAEMERYGDRATLAEANQGLDFKALSHAVRALAQVAEIYRTGALVYPLANRAELLAIKEGGYGWAELEPLILSRLQEVEELRASSRFLGRYDERFARRSLLACYGLAAPPVEAGPCSGLTEEGFAIPEDARRAIEERLEAVENEHGVRILYACESGSRGWGFASPDSDYDVRFIYVHPRDWYLSLKDGRDVIERDLEETGAGVLDINGWDLRKALRLFKSGNSTLSEWLSSPLVYRDRGGLRPRLSRLAPLAMSSLKSWHNYRSMMSGRLKDTAEATRSIKDWFYIIRPLLAMKWLEMGLGPAPMRFDRLVDKTVADSHVREELRRLVDLKSRANEKERPATPPAVIAFIREELSGRSDTPPPLADSGRLPRSALDELFLAVLRETVIQGSEGNL